MLRGGIERYVRTFPEGGFWKAQGLKLCLMGSPFASSLLFTGYTSSNFYSSRFGVRADGTSLLIALLQLQMPPRGRTFFSTSGRSRCQRTSPWKKQKRRQVQHDGVVLDGFSDSSMGTNGEPMAGVPIFPTPI